MKKNSGFTLVELLVVVVVVGISFSLAVPSFQGMMARNRLATQANDMLLAITLARSEASRVGGTVSVQAAAPVTGDEWGEGWCVVEGNPGDCTGTVIRQFPALSGISILKSVDDDANAGNWDTPRTSISFNGLGGLSTDNEIRVMDLCHEGQDGRRFQIALIGRTKIWRQAEAGDPTPPAVQPSC